MTAITRSRKNEVIEEIPLIELGLENPNKYLPYEETELKISNIFFDFKKCKDHTTESNIYEASQKYRLKRKLGFFKKAQAFFVSLYPKRVDKDALFRYVRHIICEQNHNITRDDFTHYSRAHKKCLKIIYYKSNAEYPFNDGYENQSLPNDRLEIVDIKGVKKTIRGFTYSQTVDLTSNNISEIKERIVCRLPENTYREEDIEINDVWYDFNNNRIPSPSQLGGVQARRYILKKSNHAFVASVLANVGAGMINSEDSLSAHLLPENNNFDAIFANQHLDPTQVQAITEAYKSCVEIIFYVSNDGSQTHLVPPEISPHMNRAKVAGKCIVKAASIIALIAAYIIRSLTTPTNL